MYLFEITPILFIFCQVTVPFNLYEGDTCRTFINDNVKAAGSCMDIKECPWALKRIRERLNVDTCSFVRKTPIVCCPNNNNNINKAAIKAKIKKFGEISSAKCQEYYPSGYNFAYGGVPSLVQEFPHMAILGYGTKNEIQWSCGGSLVSLQHILTAAHCLSSRNLGPVKYVRLGDLDIKSNSDEAEPQDFDVIEATGHPDYDPKTSKNDIAVLKLDREIKQTLYVKPACLHVGNKWPDDWAVTACGWGITEFAGEPSSHLMKVKLKILGNSECKRQYARAGSKSDIDEYKQICADSAVATRPMDTCEGDSGGPLQVKNFTGQTHYNLLGVTSYGKACGLSESAGVYTRVSHYVPWLESIIWNV